VQSEKQNILEPELPEPQYSFGGDDHVFVELDQAMSFRVNFRLRALTHELGARQIPGVVEIAPANASYLVRVDPDRLDPRDLVRELRRLDGELGHGPTPAFRTRIIDMPTYYNDPWSRECLMKFRDRHQNPTGTDIEYVARVNSMSEDDFIATHHGAPYLVTMVGFVPGTAWHFQMVPRERQLQVPKYIRPRTDTPERTLSHGGAFAAIYPVRGPGGYQLFARVAPPVFDAAQRLPDFDESPVLMQQGDIVKFRPIDREEYDAIRAECDAGTYRYRIRETEFDPQAFFADPYGYDDRLVKELYS
jgi:urea carboxylase